MTDPHIPPENNVEPEAENAAETIEETVARIDDEVTSLRADVEELLRGNSPETPEAPVAPPVNNPAPVPVSNPAPAVPAVQAANPVNKPDPYMREKRPVRKHGLFRRLFNN